MKKRSKDLPTGTGIGYDTKITRYKGHLIKEDMHGIRVELNGHHLGYAPDYAQARATVDLLTANQPPA